MCLVYFQYEHDQGVEHIKRNTRKPNNRKPPESNVKTQKDPKCSPSTSRTAEIPSTSTNTDPILHISDTGTSSQTAGTSSQTIGISSKTTPREAALGDIPNTRR